MDKTVFLVKSKFIMLSLLIPVYNYDVNKLVEAIHIQLVKSGIVFEIICRDDGSCLNYKSINAGISDFPFTTYAIATDNLGRVAIRHALAKKAQHAWLLFLDADTLPKSDRFNANYLAHKQSSYAVIYGGITYQTETPESGKILRLAYGRSKEEVIASRRDKTTYKIVISENMQNQKIEFDSTSAMKFKFNIS